MTQILAPIVATVWKFTAGVGDVVEAGQTVAVLESMKMEIPLVAPHAGTVVELTAAVNQIVQEGDPVVVMDP